jgi:hypothetical protein
MPWQRKKKAAPQQLRGSSAPRPCPGFRRVSLTRAKTPSHRCCSLSHDHERRSAWAKEDRQTPPAFRRSLLSEVPPTCGEYRASGTFPCGGLGSVARCYSTVQRSAPRATFPHFLRSLEIISIHPRRSALTPFKPTARRPICTARHRSLACRHMQKGGFCHDGRFATLPGGREPLRHAIQTGPQ